MTSEKARLLFNQTSVNLIPEIRKMPFRACQATLSDANGNLFVATNGCWIANATNDTMLNGSGLNPNSFTSAWCDALSAIPFPHTNILLPLPWDTSKVLLIHETGNSSVGGMSTAIYQTEIDMTLDGGLGGVTQKNVLVFNDTLIPGMAVCRHGNGRDWWLVAFKENSSIMHKFLISPSGIAYWGSQNFNMLDVTISVGQPVFSPDGKKFAITTGYNGPPILHDTRLFDFDRCTGMFSNPIIINLMNGNAGFGTAFSSNSKYLYATSFQHVYQINTDTTNIPASLQVVAVNDTFYSPFPPFQTDFWLMYLAANGKIYISSGNGVLDMHYINYPDSVGVSCGVQQHALHLPCYSGRGNVYHPNYYLGAADGTVCDSLGLNGLQESTYWNMNMQVKPNPSKGVFEITYFLPQNRSGELHIMNLEGKRVYALTLPPWSNYQTIDVSFLPQGIYSATISSEGFREAKKLVLVR